MKSLKQTRIEAGFSRPQIETTLGINTVQLSLIERGINSPNLLTRTRLELFFGTKIDWLDTPTIDSEPREPVATWNDTEREFRYLIHQVASLPNDEINDFIDSAVKHLKKLKIHEK
jgi:transcriptional regulator with XRE-family HTH domain